MHSLRIVLPIILMVWSVRSADWQEQHCNLRQILGPNTICKDMLFISRNKGWIISEDTTDTDSIIVKTSDGGKNWTKADFSQDAIENRIISTVTKATFPDSLHGWITIGDSLYHTVNGGDDWKLMNQSLKDLGEICFSSDSKGVASKSFDGIVFTTDSGRTWKTSDLQFEEDCHFACSFYFLDSLKGYASFGGCVTSSGTILQTENGGKNWINTNIRGDLIYAVDSVHLLAIGTSEVDFSKFLTVSSDGGKTATTLNSNDISENNTAFMSLDALFDNSGYGIVYGHTFQSKPPYLSLESEDQGHTWEPLSLFGDNPVAGSVYIDESLIVVTESGRLFIREEGNAVTNRITHDSIKNTRNNFRKYLSFDNKTGCCRYGGFSLKGELIKGNSVPSKGLRIITSSDITR